MDKKYVEENEIEIKYLRNQLTPEELEEFEVYLMENPEMVESLELHDYLSDAIINDEFGVSEKPRNWKELLFSLPFERLVFFTFGALVMTTLLYKTPTSQPKTVYFSQTRSSNTALEFRFPESSYSFWNSDQIIITVEISSLKSSGYKLTIFELHDDRENVVSNLDNLNIDAFGNLTVLLEVGDYPPGKYRMLVSNQEVSNAISEFEFVTIVER